MNRSWGWSRSFSTAGTGVDPACCAGTPTTVANDTFIGVVDSCAQEKFREKLSEIACKLHKHIEDVEEQEFKAEAQEAFKLNDGEMKLFDF